MAIRNRRAFTLIELIVVLAVTGVLLGLSLNAVQSVRSAANKLACANNLKQLGLAAHGHEEVKGHLPRAYTEVRDTFSRNKNNPMKWTVGLLPYLGEDNIYREAYAAHRIAWSSSNPPHIHMTTVVKVFACPADPRLSRPITDDLGHTAAYASYCGVVGDKYVRKEPGSNRGPWVPQFLGVFSGEKVPFAAITDGTSSTILLAERVPEGRDFNGNWYAAVQEINRAGVNSHIMEHDLPARYYEGQRCRGPFRFGPVRLGNVCDTEHFGSLHPSGSNILFCDGGVRFLAYSAVAVMPALSSRAGGEVVEIP